MPLDELYYWMAWDALKDEKYKERIEKQIAENLTREEEAEAIRRLLMSLQG